jgi:hypothetical protein
MKNLFSPCTRFFDLLENQGTRGTTDGGWHLEEFKENDMEDFETLKERNLNVSTEELLSAERGFTYADLYAMLENGDMVAWLTPLAGVVRVGGDAHDCSRTLNRVRLFSFNADRKQQVVAFARSHEALLEICDVLVRLLAVSAVHRVDLHSIESLNSKFAAPTLAFLMEHCQSLKTLTLKELKLDETHCRVLGTYSRPDLEIELNRCRVTGSGASALAEVLGCNQGPTKLDLCYIDNSVLADGLRGNSRLHFCRPRLSGNFEVGNREVLAYALALPENLGLVVFKLSDCFLSDETWDAICDSLKTHPTLEILNLQKEVQTLGEAPFDPAVLKPHIQALVDMLKVNMSIHTINGVPPLFREHELFQGSVIPYLETNRIRDRVRAIQRTCPIAYRAKVLGRALLSVKSHPNRFWMLLSGNAEVAFP